MATIRNSISMQDKMSSTFTHITKAMQSTLKVMQSVDAAANNGAQSKAYQAAQRDINRANSAIINMARNTNAAEAEANQTARAVDNIGTAAADVDRVTRATEELAQSANRAEVEAGQSARALDELANSSAGVDRVTRSTDRLSRSTNRTEVEANQTARAMKRIGAATQSMSAVSIYALMAIGQQFMQLINFCTEYLDKITLIEARLNLVNDGLQTTAELQDKILAAANRARMSYSDMASSVAKLNMLASDFFNSNDEAIAFVETLNKMFVVSGTGAQEASAAMYQLMQAMGAGKLQGDEFRSIMENAPMLADAIAVQMGKTKGQLKELSSDGKITADIIKAAMFNAADGINEKFASMPKTFGQMMQLTKNLMMKAMEPVAKEFSTFINSAEGQVLFTDLAKACVNFANIALKGLKLISKGIAFMKKNWESIKSLIVSVGIALATCAAISAGAWIIANLPLVALIGILYLIINVAMAFGATVGDVFKFIGGLLILLIPLFVALGIAAVQYFLIPMIAGVLAAIPTVWGLAMAWLAVNWPLLLVVLGVILLIAVMGQFGVSTADILGFVMGLFYMLGAVITNIFILLYNVFGSFVVFISNLFINPLAAIKMLFMDMGLYIVDTIHWVAKALEDLVNMIPGVEINITSGLESIMAKIQAARSAVESESGVEKFQELESMDLGSEFNRGNGIGANLGSGGGGGGISLPKLPAALDPSKFGAMMPGSGLDDGKLKGGKLDEVGKINDDVTITDEDIKMLKDIASTEFVNSYTTLRPEMKVSFGDVRETADVDSILTRLDDLTEQALNNSIIEEAS